MAELDLIFFTGDAAFSGKAAEYAQVSAELLEPLIEVSGVARDRLFLIPGNHDVDRSAWEYISTDRLRSLEGGDATSAFLKDEIARTVALQPMSAYAKFAHDYMGELATNFAMALGYGTSVTVRGVDVGVVGLNSAWLSGLNRDSDGLVDDKGHLMVGYPQAYWALEALPPVDLTIGLVHHPISWLKESDAHDVDRLLLEKCDVILHGHQHVADAARMVNASGDAAIITCGATYDREPSRYPNSYSYTVVDSDPRASAVFVRAWSGRRDRWIADDDMGPGGRVAIALSSKPSHTAAEHETVPAAAPPAELSSYRQRVAADHYYVNHRGIAGVAGAAYGADLAMDDVYVLPRLAASDLTTDGPRESELLKALVDPQISAEARARFEAEYAELTGTSWRSADADVAIASFLANLEHAVLIGSPGTGKSTFLRYLARRAALGGEQMSQSLGWAADVTPLLIPIAEYADAKQSGGQQSLRSFIGTRLRDRHGDGVAAAVEQELSDGRALVLLDGVDEVPSASARSAVVRHVDEFIRDFGQNRIVVTSRPYGYVRLSGDIPHYTLPNFSSRQVDEFVRRYQLAIDKRLRGGAPDPDRASREAEDLLSEIAGNPRIADLATNPLMLVLISLLRYERARLAEQRVELYSRAVTTLLDTWRQWRSATGRPVTSLPLDRLIPVWADVAYWTRDTRPTGIVHRADLKRRIADVLESAELEDRAFGERADVYLEAAAEGGLVEERGHDVFGFWHPTFEEFLAAVRLSTPTGQAVAGVLAVRSDPRWREVIRLAVGYVGVVQRDVETATDMVSAIWLGDAVPIDRVIRGSLSLAEACVIDYPGVRRPLAEDLLGAAIVAAVQLPHGDFPDLFVSLASAFRGLTVTDGVSLKSLRFLAAEASEWEVRAGAVRLLAVVANDDADAHGACEEALADPDPDVACISALAVLRHDLRRSDALACAAMRFDNTFADVEADARPLLARVEQPTYVEALENTVQPWALARQLDKLGRADEEIREVLRDRVNDSPPDNEVDFQWAVAVVGEDTLVSILHTQVASGDTEQRWSAVAVLSATGHLTPDEHEEALAVVREGDGGTAFMAATAIQGHPDVIPLLRALAGRLGDPDAEARAYAAFVIETALRHGLHPDAASLLTSTDDALRLAGEVVARDSQRALEVLLDIARPGVSEFRDAAVLRLSRRAVVARDAAVARLVLSAAVDDGLPVSYRIAVDTLHQSGGLERADIEWLRSAVEAGDDSEAVTAALSLLPLEDDRTARDKLINDVLGRNLDVSAQLRLVRALSETAGYEERAVRLAYGVISAQTRSDEDSFYMESVVIPIATAIRRVPALAEKVESVARRRRPPTRALLARALSAAGQDERSARLFIGLLCAPERVSIALEAIASGAAATNEDADLLVELTSNTPEDDDVTGVARAWLYGFISRTLEAGTAKAEPVP